MKEKEMKEKELMESGDIAYAAEKSKSESTHAALLEIVGQAEKACNQGGENDQS